jgi:serine/threonine transporter
MWERITRISLIKRILIGIVIGAILGVAIPSWTWLEILGDLFVNSLKAIAPLLVFMLIMSSMSKHEKGAQTHMRSIVVLYLMATFVAALVAVGASYLFPVDIILPKGTASAAAQAPQGLAPVIKNLFNSAIENPVKALTEGNYLALLVWASLIGIGLRPFAGTTKKLVSDFSSAITNVVQFIIQLAPTWDRWFSFPLSCRNWTWWFSSLWPADLAGRRHNGLCCFGCLPSNGVINDPSESLSTDLIYITRKWNSGILHP